MACRLCPLFNTQPWVAYVKSKNGVSKPSASHTSRELTTPSHKTSHSWYLLELLVNVYEGPSRCRHGVGFLLEALIGRPANMTDDDKACEEAL